jgi:ABC-type antimicrobial peptide transport system permease subunit
MRVSASWTKRERQLRHRDARRDHRLRDRLFGTIFIVRSRAGIALIVGAIVIMNIMLVSVTSARRRSASENLWRAADRYLKQFLVEAVRSRYRRRGGNFSGVDRRRVVTAWIFPTYLSISAISARSAASGGAGVASGIFPAWKAARLDPIEA